MFDRVDADETVVILGFIPEVVWHRNIRTIPLERTYETMVKCFNYSSGRPVVIPRFRNMAYSSAKALLHLVIQCKCIGYGFDTPTFNSISRRYLIMGPEDYKDPDLGSTLHVIDRILGNSSRPVYWESWDNSFSATHNTWMSRILLYRAWSILKKGGPLPDYIAGFILHFPQLVSSPPATVRDCLFIIGLVFGLELDIGDLSTADER